MSFTDLYRQPKQNEPFSTAEIVDSLRVLASKKNKAAFVKVPGSCIVTVRLSRRKFMCSCFMSAGSQVGDESRRSSARVDNWPRLQPACGAC